MTINANLKTLIQSRIDAATGATPLEDLFNLKMLARGLDCNETTLNTLIQTHLSALGPSTELKSLLKGALSVRPYAKNIVWKTQTFLTSGTFTRPAKMVGDTAWVTASAGGGGGTPYSNFSVIRGACGGSWCKDRAVNVPVGSSQTVVIGAGGTQNNAGGNTTFGTQLVLRGGSSAMSASTSDGVTMFSAATSQSFTNMVNVIGVHPGWTCFVAPLAPTESAHKTSVLHVPPESVNGFVGVGMFYSDPEGRFIGAGPAAGYYGAPAASYNDATPANTGCGGWSANSQTGRSGSAGRLDIGWWEYE